ncbi:MAG TPA: glycosyltransferase family 39 protein [Candidatus Binataceae bacterium]|nr:glycosyltransferase family 39 protein [Candidatus Binataceae bacterium]
MNRGALLLLIIALIIGAFLRFHDLDALQMSADEGATWAAADAPSISELVAIQRTHNAGKLPVHDLMLHGWIAMFGDGLFAMRSFSALLGLVTILLMFPMTRELFRTGISSLPRDDIDFIAGLSALICAVSIVTIKYDREARMYGLLLALAVAHVWIFLRTIRHQSITDYIALAILTTAVLAVNLITAGLIATEGLWLVVILATSYSTDYRSALKVILTTGLAMAGGAAVLVPALYVPFLIGRHMLASGQMDWLTRPQWWEPFAFFNKASGSVAFPVLAVLAAWGAWNGWARARMAIEFTVLWMWAPPIILVAGSFIWRPVFLERYAIYSFPAFFILIALGIAQLRSEVVRGLAIVAVVTLALGHVYSYSIKTHDADWREAGRVALASVGAQEQFAVMPAYAVEVVRYYMPPATRQEAIPYDATTNHSRVAVLAEHGVRDTNTSGVRRDFPHVIARTRGIVVLAR